MTTTIPNPTDMCIIVTYRCPMKCQMCDIWKNPTQKEKEITIAEIEKLPSVKFINITGGEPFVREDLEEIIDVINIPIVSLSPLLVGLKIVL